MDEDRRGPEAWTAVHGPANGDTTPPDTAGPSVEALRRR
jgi:hypothetical protein